MAFEDTPLSYRPTPQASDLREALTMPLKFHMQRKQQEELKALEEQRLARETQRDTRNDTRENASLALRKEEMEHSDKRAGQRESLFAKQEDRRQAASEREHSDKDRAEREALFRDYQMALQIPDPQARASALHAAEDALRRNGVQAEEFGQHFGNPPPSATPAASQGRQGLAPVDDGSDVGGLQNGPTPGTSHAQSQKPMLPGEAGSIGRQLDQAGSGMLRGLPAQPQQNSAAAVLGHPVPAMDRRQAMGAADASGALGIEQVPGGWQPIPQAESDRDNNDPSIATPPMRTPLPGQMSLSRVNTLADPTRLAADDPYNKYR